MRYTLVKEDRNLAKVVTMEEVLETSAKFTGDVYNLENE